MIKKIFLVLVFLVMLMAGAAMLSDLGETMRHIREMSPKWILAALGLALMNFVMRMFKWAYYLVQLKQKVPLGKAAAVFFSGLAMSMTPGKLGELLKALLLKETADVPVAVTAPVVLAERLTDLMALVILVTSGVWMLNYGLDVLIVATLMCLTVILGVVYPPFARLILWVAARIPGVRRFTPILESALGNMSSLLRPTPLILTTVLSVVAWFMECLAFHVVLVGLGQSHITVFQSTFIYGIATIAGAVSMLPGGLVATEGSMVLLLTTVMGLTGPNEAVAATLVVRVCTLWHAVVLGGAVLFGNKGTREALLKNRETMA